MIKPLEPIRLLELEFGATRITRAEESLKRDELWQGEGTPRSGNEAATMPIYLRVASPAPLLAELLCCVIARGLGLPAPEPFAVLVPPGALPGSRFASSVEPKLYVATADLGGNSFTQLLNGNSESAKSLLRKWDQLVPVTVLDEWLANTDRNFGNLLWVSHTIHIIDHADAFGGSALELFGLTDLCEVVFENKLGILLTEHHAAERQAKLASARNWIADTARALDITSAVNIAHAHHPHATPTTDELVHFINTRLPLTHTLLCNRLGLPQLAFPI